VNNNVNSSEYQMMPRIPLWVLCLRNIFENFAKLGLDFYFLPRIGISPMLYMSKRGKVIVGKNGGFRDQGYSTPR